MADISVVFNEISRVTKPGGVVVILEMTADGNTETQMIHVLLHHWWAELDRRRDVYHDAIWLRSDILAFLEFFKF
jgi:ubiquinone/menaquinone biosynthesis C-methylase UbiE